MSSVKFAFSRLQGDFYFLTDPEIFINDHFPYDKHDATQGLQWQLLKSPVDFKVFNATVRKTKYAYHFQVAPMSHKDSVISIENEEDVFVKSFPVELNNFSANLISRNGTSCNDFVFVYKKEKNVYGVKIRPPSPTTFDLEIFGQRSEDVNDRTLELLFNYVVICKSTQSDPQRFPFCYPPYLQYNVSLLEPLTGILPAKTEIKIRFTSPELICVLVNEQTKQKDRNNLFEITTVTPSSGQSLGVYGSTNSSNSFEGIFEFKIK